VKSDVKNDTLCFSSDNPDVDIVGANMYNRYLQQDITCRTSLSGYGLIRDTKYLSARTCESILVCTGVYDPSKQTTAETEAWKTPTSIQADVFEAVKYVLAKEQRP
jgi:hypothetical protein